MISCGAAPASVPFSSLFSCHFKFHPLNLTVHGVESEALLLLLDQAGICASSGSACLSDSPDLSHVIAPMKPGPAARQSVRFSLGAGFAFEKIETILVHLIPIISSLRGMS